MGSHTGEFWIRREEAYPVMAAVRRRHVPSPVAINDNKENVAPPRCRARGRKSPLPNWYPRAPLRDVTVIVNALEKRRKRARAARAQQVNTDPVVSPIANPVADDSNANDPSPSPASVGVSPLSPIEHPLETFCPSSSNPSVEDKKQSKYEKKLESSLQIFHHKRFNSSTFPSVENKSGMGEELHGRQRKMGSRTERDGLGVGLIITQ